MVKFKKKKNYEFKSYLYNLYHDIVCVQDPSPHLDLHVWTVDSVELRSTDLRFYLEAGKMSISNEELVLMIQSSTQTKDKIVLE